MNVRRLNIRHVTTCSLTHLKQNKGKTILAADLLTAKCGTHFIADLRQNKLNNEIAQGARLKGRGVLGQNNKMHLGHLSIGVKWVCFIFIFCLSGAPPVLRMTNAMRADECIRFACVRACRLFVP